MGNKSDSLTVIHLADSISKRHNSEKSISEGKIINLSEFYTFQETHLECRQE